MKVTYKVDFVLIKAKKLVVYNFNPQCCLANYMREVLIKTSHLAPVTMKLESHSRPIETRHNVYKGANLVIKWFNETDKLDLFLVDT